MAIPTYLWTAKDIINSVAPEVGLAEFTDPYSSVDENARRLRACLKTAGLELSGLRQWPLLRKEHNFTTVDTDSGIYQLPPDFRSMVDQTGWDRVGMVELEGPLTAQEWHYVVALAETTTISAFFREAAGELWLYPQPPPIGLEVNFEYASRYWVASTGAPEIDKAFPTVATDIVMFDPLLVTRALKYHFKGETGQDVTKARADYEAALTAVESQEPAKILTLYKLEKPSTAVYTVQIETP